MIQLLMCFLYSCHVVGIENSQYGIYYSIFAFPLPSMDLNNPANFRSQSVTNVISKKVGLLFQERPSIYDAMTSSRNHSLFGQVRLSEYNRPGPRTGKGWPLTGEDKTLSQQIILNDLCTSRCSTEKFDLMCCRARWQFLTCKTWYRRFT